MKKMDWKIPYARPCVSRGLLEAGLSPLLCRVLSLRGVNTPDEARAMLYGGTKFTVIPTNLYNGMAKFLLLAIPFFVISMIRC